MTAAVGLLLFQNFWFWYPLTNFLSLALSPTTLIALNKDLKMPKMQFKSNAKPSTFAYPQPLLRQHRPSPALESRTGAQIYRPGQKLKI
ncbi:hypothetical protein X801_08754 [Opisthorchis viverrini]|uniref:26S proteasome regulatory subunit RPN2 C-terminal domain-containing protein n=1 Tax=Opisthorchis viverrini TaxID=6198 RepID=A0A1S8WM19_OPIVI|nr:hypothetical protein X801_08754 [Opisthorchis viverrini]